jgi:transketolase
VDINGMQVDGPMKEIMPIEPIGDKFAAFGWQVFEVDGNDVDAITEACKKAQSSDKPVAILCRTKPWTGFTFLKKRWDDKKLHFIRLTESEREGLEKEIAAK